MMKYHQRQTQKLPKPGVFPIHSGYPGEIFQDLIEKQEIRGSEVGAHLIISCVFFRVIRLHESGLLAVWRQRYWPRLQRCATSRMARGIAVADLLGVFYTGLALLLLSSCLLLSELLLHCRARTTDSGNPDVLENNTHL